MANRRPVCRFFQQGRCTRGAACLFPHVESTTMNVVPTTTPVPANRILQSTPTAAYTDPAADGAVLVPKICPYFFAGTCRYPGGCRDLHDDPDALEVPLVKEIDGAEVSFTAGAEVSALSLTSDFSTAEVMDLRSNDTTQDVLDYLTGLDINFEGSAVDISIKPSPDPSKFYASVKVNNPDFAANCYAQAKAPKNSRFWVRPPSIAGSDNQQHVTEITCSWNRASQRADVRFCTASCANEAIERLGNKVEVDGRSLGIQRQGNTRVTFYNVDPHTTQDTMKISLGIKDCPVMTMIPPQHELSDNDAFAAVKCMLQKVEQPILWGTTVGKSKMTALARFQNVHACHEAISQHDQKEIPGLGSLRLTIKLLVRVEYRRPTDICNALKQDIMTMKADAWTADRVTINDHVIKHENAKTIIRVSGEDSQAVAKYKVQLEKLLAGLVLMDEDGEAIWCPLLFSKVGFGFIRKLKAYVRMDSTKQRIVLYGAAAAMEDAAQELKEKLASSGNGQHRWILSNDDYHKAVKGGMSHLATHFGAEVVQQLVVTANEKAILVHGLQETLQKVRKTFKSYASIDSTEDATQCVVCWTAPEDPVNTLCNHVYCRECFTKQCAAASDLAAGFPIHCLGNGDKCKTVLTNATLQDILSPGAFTKLLRASYMQHIKRNSEALQFCPSPDCNQIYRPTAIGRLFNCTNCLTSICTTCSTDHAGLTCIQYKSVSAADTDFLTYKEENGVKDCPKCNAPIEKSEGCNHMVCEECRTHICWVCLKNFNSAGECYAHLESEHGGINDEGDHLIDPADAQALEDALAAGGGWGAAPAQFPAAFGNGGWGDEPLQADAQDGDDGWAVAGHDVLAPFDMDAIDMAMAEANRAIAEANMAIAEDEAPGGVIMPAPVDPPPHNDADAGGEDVVPQGEV